MHPETIGFQYAAGGAGEFMEPSFEDGQSMKKSGPTKLVFFEYVLN